MLKQRVLELESVDDVCVQVCVPVPVRVWGDGGVVELWVWARA